MKPFSLSAVLRYRKQLEDMAATRLAEAQAQEQLIFNQLKSLQREHNNLVSDLAKYQSAGMGVVSLVRYEDRIFWLKNQIKEISKKLKEETEKVLHERLNVLSKSRNKQILEQLKEKQNRAWRKHLEKKETAQLDEIAVLSHERKQKNQSR